MQISLTSTSGGALGKRLWSVWLTAAGWFWVADFTDGAQTSAIEAAINAQQYPEAQILVEDVGRPFANLPAGYEAALESARLLPEGMEEIGEAYQALSIEAETLFGGGDLAAGIEAQESLLMFSSDLLGADHSGDVEQDHERKRKIALVDGFLPWARGHWPAGDPGHDERSRRHPVQHPCRRRLLCHRHTILRPQNNALQIFDLARVGEPWRRHDVHRRVVRPVLRSWPPSKAGLRLP